MAQKLTIKGSLYLVAAMLGIAFLTGNILFAFAVFFVGYTVMTS